LISLYLIKVCRYIFFGILLFWNNCAFTCIYQITTQQITNTFYPISLKGNILHNNSTVSTTGKLLLIKMYQSHSDFTSLHAFIYYLVLFFKVFFDTSFCVAQAGLKLMILLQSPCAGMVLCIFILYVDSCGINADKNQRNSIISFLCYSFMSTSIPYPLATMNQFHRILLFRKYYVNRVKQYVIWDFLKLSTIPLRFIQLVAVINSFFLFCCWVIYHDLKIPNIVVNTIIYWLLNSSKENLVYFQE
jgi:hypothetical protein